MKPSSGFLWQLIHSLESSEKLFFKRNFLPDNQSRLYIRLFDAIASQKVYDEDALLEKFKPAINKKNMASQKHYLQKQIGEALVLYAAKKDPVHDLYGSIQLIRIYRKKGLYEEAYAVWEKAMQKARKTESFAMLHLLKTEFEKMVIMSHTHSGYDEMLAMFKKNVISYSGYASLITLRDIYMETLLLRKKSHLSQDESLKERMRILLERVEQADTGTQDDSFLYKNYYAMSRATLLYLLNDTAGSVALLKNQFIAWKKNKQYIPSHGEFYIELLYMINYAGILNGSFDYVSSVFSDELNTEITNKNQRAYFEAIKYLALNKIFNKTARYDEVKKLVDFMKSIHKRWEPSLNEELNSTVNFSLGVASFALEQYEDALYFTKRAITGFPEGTREEQVSVGQLLLLLIAWNIGNPRVFESQYRATYTYFYKRKKKQVFETALVQCLHRTFYMQEQKKKTAEFKKTLQLLEENNQLPLQQRAFSIFNFPGWLQSKILRLSYRSYVEKKVKATRAIHDPFN